VIYLSITSQKYWRIITADHCPSKKKLNPNSISFSLSFVLLSNAKSSCNFFTPNRQLKERKKNFLHLI
jgi:hypothetical protein